MKKIHFQVFLTKAQCKCIIAGLPYFQSMNNEDPKFLTEKVDPVLVVEDDATATEVICGVLEANGIATEAVNCGAKAVELLQSGRVFAALLIDIGLPDIDGISVLAAARKMLRSVPCYMLTAKNDPKLVVRAMKMGAIDYFTKPCDYDALIDEIRRVIASQYGGVDDLGGLIVPVSYRKSALVMQALLHAERALHDDAPVLIRGPRFVGKGLLARMIHARSVPQRLKVIKIDLAAYGSDDAEVELFGMVAGEPDAYSMKRDCLLNSCGDSTLLIENIEYLQPDAQAVLANWLASIETDSAPFGRPRIIAISCVDLNEIALDGRFRADLVALLSTHLVELPGLCDLEDEFPKIANEMLGRLCVKSGHRNPSLSDCAIQRLSQYDWPLNLLELKNVLVSALANSSGDIINSEHLSNLPMNLRLDYDGIRNLNGPQQSIDEVLKDSLVGALKASGGNRKVAAQILKVSLRTVYNMIDRYELDIPASRRRKISRSRDVGQT
jgi:DNA-binding NtrC family response regulator